MLTTAIALDCPFFRRYGEPAPRGLRDAARGLSWTEFRDTYAPCTALAVEDLVTRRHPDGGYEVAVALRIGARRHRAGARGSGPVSAATELLYRLGHGVEVLSFHQVHVAEGTATFLYVLDPRTSARRWTFAVAHDDAESAVRALLGAAGHGIRDGGRSASIPARTT